MNSNFSRRDFLKLAGLLPLSYFLPRKLTSYRNSSGIVEKENIIILVFDAWSAANTSLYGYPRKTMPNLEKLAEKAIVYHKHYAGSHYTTPGTASLLTGTTTWTHQAYNLHSKLIDGIAKNNIFSAFPNHNRLAYTHNSVAQNLLLQVTRDVDTFTPREHLFFESERFFTSLFKNDFDTAFVGRNQAFKQKDDGFSYSLFLARLYQGFKNRSAKRVREYFPRGVPGQGGFDFFLLEDSIDWIINTTERTTRPFLGYYHLYPPHEPYHTRVDFYNAFAKDNYTPPRKPGHFFEGISIKGGIEQQRRWYDEYLLYVDAEFARLYEALERSGVLENTWVVLTTDHGEMFERGIMGHLTPVFYQPIIHVPLLIFPPGQETRMDIYDNTSAIDLLPTMLHLTGQEIPAWAEGQVIAPFSESTSSEKKSISSIQVEILDKQGNILAATAMLIQENYKLIWSFGYEEIQKEELVELYDLEADPEELTDLSSERKNITAKMLDTLKQNVAAFNQSKKGS